MATPDGSPRAGARDDTLSKRFDEMNNQGAHPDILCLADKNAIQNYAGKRLHAFKRAKSFFDNYAIVVDKFAQELKALCDKETMKIERILTEEGESSSDGGWQPRSNVWKALMDLVGDVKVAAEEQEIMAGDIKERTVADMQLTFDEHTRKLREHENEVRQLVGKLRPGESKVSQAHKRYHNTVARNHGRDRASREKVHKAREDYEKVIEDVNHDQLDTKDRMTDELMCIQNEEEERLKQVVQAMQQYSDAQHKANAALRDASDNAHRAVEMLNPLHDAEDSLADYAHAHRDDESEVLDLLRPHSLARDAMDMQSTMSYRDRDYDDRRGGGYGGGYNDRGYNRGYDDRDRGRGGYDDRDRGYDDRDRDRGYNDHPRGSSRADARDAMDPVRHYYDDDRRGGDRGQDLHRGSSQRDNRSSFKYSNNNDEGSRW